MSAYTQKRENLLKTAALRNQGQIINDRINDVFDTSSDVLYKASNYKEYSYRSVLQAFEVYNKIKDQIKECVEDISLLGELRDLAILINSISTLSDTIANETFYIMISNDTVKNAMTDIAEKISTLSGRAQKATEDIQVIINTASLNIASMMSCIKSIQDCIEENFLVGTNKNIEISEQYENDANKLLNIVVDVKELVGTLNSSIENVTATLQQITATLDEETNGIEFNVSDEMSPEVSSNVTKLEKCKLYVEELETIINQFVGNAVA